jgi:peptide deformylase
MPSEPLTDLRRLGAILAQLREVLYSIEYAAGLAAIQIGLPVRVAIVNLARTPDAEKLLINPVVLQIT